MGEQRLARWGVCTGTTTFANHCLVWTAATVALLGAEFARAELTVLDSFESGFVTLVGLGYDELNDSIWVYASQETDLARYSSGGIFQSSVPRPGESANDFDITFAPTSFTLNATQIAAGTMLAINGETDTAEIYALDQSDGTPIASLNSQFGMSHVHGGAYHPSRGTFFLLQDREASGSDDDNRIAEVDPVTGSVLNSFLITDVLPNFTVNFGDLEVAANGDLFVVSSDETSIAQLSPEGSLVAELPLPTEMVMTLSGIGLDNSNGEAWVSSTTGTVWRLGGLPIVPSRLPGDYDDDGDVDEQDYTTWQSAFGSNGPFPITGINADGNSDNVVNLADYTIWRDNLGSSNLDTLLATSLAVPEPNSRWLAVGIGGLFASVFLALRNLRTPTSLAKSCR